MREGRNIVGMMLSLGVLLALSVGLAGCGSDLYAACSLPEQLECSNKEGASCVEKQNLQCDTDICAKYRGIGGFCTIECTSDSDCTDGQCKRFIITDDTKYCVQNSDVADAEERTQN